MSKLSSHAQLGKTELVWLSSAKLSAWLSSAKLIMHTELTKLGLAKLSSQFGKTELTGSVWPKCARGLNLGN